MIDQSSSEDVVQYSDVALTKQPAANATSHHVHGDSIPEKMAGSSTQAIKSSEDKSAGTVRKLDLSTITIQREQPMGTFVEHGSTPIKDDPSWIQQPTSSSSDNKKEASKNAGETPKRATVKQRLGVLTHLRAKKQGTEKPKPKLKKSQQKMRLLSQSKLNKIKINSRLIRLTRDGPSPQPTLL